MLLSSGLTYRCDSQHLDARKKGTRTSEACQAEMGYQCLQGHGRFASILMAYKEQLQVLYVKIVVRVTYEPILALICLGTGLKCKHRLTRCLTPPESYKRWVAWSLSASK